MSIYPHPWLGRVEKVVVVGLRGENLLHRLLLRLVEAGHTGTENISVALKKL